MRGEKLDSKLKKQEGTTVTDEGSRLQAKKRAGIARRVWRRRAAQMVVAWAAAVLLDRVFGLDPVRRFVDGRVGSVAFAALLLGVGIACLGARRLAKQYGWHFSRDAVLSYPPSWIPGFLALLLFLLQDWEDWACASQGKVTCIIVFPVAVGMSQLWRVRSGTGLQEEVQAATQVFDHLPLAIPKSFEEIQRWLESDDAVVSMREDRFGDHAKVARRIATRLKSSPRSSVIVQGDRGAGKSTVGCFVSELLAGTSWRTVQLSLWPFASVDAAASGVLNAIVRELATVVDVSGIRGISNGYRRLAASADSRIGHAVDFLFPPREIREILDSIDQRACAAGVHVLLWIDDLERFEPRLGPGADGGEAVFRVAPLHGLVHELNKCEHVTLVLAAAWLGDSFDPGKLGRFVERIPPVKPRAVWGIVDVFRDGLSLSAEQGEYDAASMLASEGKSSTRALLNWPNDSWGQGLKLDSFSDSGVTTHKALAVLLNNPRRLKSALRLAADKWRVLRGEIDFDDLLLMCALETACPSLFEWVQAHHKLLGPSGGAVLVLPETLRRQGEGTHNPKEVDAARESLGAMLTELGDEEQARAAREVLVFVYIGESGMRVVGPGKLQGIMSEGPRDYFGRYLVGLPVENEERDQSMLQRVASWNQDREGGLPQCFVDPGFLGAAFAFSRLLDPGALKDLLHPVCKLIVDLPPGNWGRENRLPALGDLYNLLYMSGIDGKGIADAFRAIATEFVGVHLPLATWLRELVADPTMDRSNSLSRELRVGLKNDLLLGFVDAYSKDPARLIGALKGGDDYTLCNLVWDLEAMRSHRLDKIPSWDRDEKGAHRFEEIPFPQWESISETLMDAAQADPVTFAYQILPFFVFKDDPMEVRQESEREFRFQADIAERLFGIDRIREVFGEMQTAELPGSDRARRLQATQRGLAALREQSDS